MQYKSLLLMLTSMLTFSGCSPKKTVKKHIELKKIKKPTQEKTQPSKVIPVTVWIHGTKSMGKLSDFVHAVDKKGLTHVSNIAPSYRLKKVITSLSHTDKEHFPYEHCYAYGWSGDLSFQARKQEAQHFYTALKLLAQEYETTHGLMPHFTIITHSHGGNVLLNSATCREKDCTLTIKKAILLACPVQHETKQLISDPFFEKVYSLYSTMDMVQVLDPQGLYKTEHNKKPHLEFSGRQFPFAKNIRQIKLSINNHGIMHVGFVVPSFAQLLPEIIACIEQWEDEHPSQEDQERILSIQT